MKNKIKNTLPKNNLTHGNIYLGNYSINGLQIFEDSVVVPFYFSGSNKARTTAKIEDILKLCDGFSNLRDCNIPYSYVRMEIDPVDTTIESSSNVQINSIGLEEDGFDEYFAGGLSCDIDGIADFLYIDTGVGSAPIDKIKEKRDKYMTMYLNGTVSNATIYLEITIFYFYIPSIHSQRINHVKLIGKGSGRQFYAIDYIKDKKYYEDINEDKVIEENKDTLIRQINPFRENDRIQFVYYDKHNIRRYMNVRVTGFSTNVYQDDIIELNESIPNIDGYLYGIQNPCLEENCKWHSGDMNPMKHKYDEQCNDCREANGNCNSRRNYSNNSNRYRFNDRGGFRNWGF